jgi:hypothetical protein
MTEPVTRSNRLIRVNFDHRMEHPSLRNGRIESGKLSVISTSLHQGRELWTGWAVVDEPGQENSRLCLAVFTWFDPLGISSPPSRGPKLNCCARNLRSNPRNPAEVYKPFVVLQTKYDLFEMHRRPFRRRDRRARGHRKESANQQVSGSNAPGARGRSTGIIAILSRLSRTRQDAVANAYTLSL